MQNDDLDTLRMVREAIENGSCSMEAWYAQVRHKDCNQIDAYEVDATIMDKAASALDGLIARMEQNGEAAPTTKTYHIGDANEMMPTKDDHHADITELVHQIAQDICAEQGDGIDINARDDYGKYIWENYITEAKKAVWRVLQWQEKHHG